MDFVIMYASHLPLCEVCKDQWSERRREKERREREGGEGERRRRRRELGKWREGIGR